MSAFIGWGGAQDPMKSRAIALTLEGRQDPAYRAICDVDLQTISPCLDTA